MFIHTEVNTINIISTVPFLIMGPHAVHLKYDGQAKPVRALVRYCNVHECQWNTVTDTVCSIVILPLVPGQYYVRIHVLRCDITYNTVMSRILIMCTGIRNL